MVEKNINDYVRDPDFIRKELIDNYEQWGTTQYYITDDTFNDSPQKIQMMVDVTRSLPFKPEYWAFTRLDLLMAYPETIPLLREMGLKHTYIGVETFHEMAGKVIGKGTPKEKKIWGLEQLRNVWGDSVHIQSGFIVGLPHEDLDSIKWTAEYLNSPDCPIHLAWLYPLFLTATRPNTQHINKSTFDIEHEKYGYYFPNQDKFDYWQKDDNTGINNYYHSYAISEEHNVNIKKTLHPGFWNDAVFDYPKHNGKKSITITEAEYCEAIHDAPTLEVTRAKVLETYFKPLIAKLEERRRPSSDVNQM